MAYDLGDVVPLGIEIRDVNGTLANATLVKITVTGPDGVVVVNAVTVNPASTGIYNYDYTPAAVGAHAVLWVATGTNAGAYSDTIVVRERVASAVSLADLKTHLNITSTTSDEELRRTLDAAVAAAESYTRQTFAARSFTETHSGGNSSVILWHSPVQSVTQVTESGTTLAASDYTVDPASGLLTRRASTYVTTQWAGGFRNIVVTYVAGAPTLGEDARQGVLEIARHLWTSQRGGVLPGGVNNSDEWNPSLGFSIPRRVQELFSKGPAGIA